MTFDEAKQVIRNNIQSIDALIMKPGEVWLAPDNESQKDFIERIFKDKVVSDYKDVYRMKSLPGVEITFQEYTVTLKSVF